MTDEYIHCWSCGTECEDKYYYLFFEDNIMEICPDCNETVKENIYIYAEGIWERNIRR